MSNVAKNYTENAEAYRLYLQGRYYWYKFPAKEFEKSRDYYQQAIDTDPNYAPTYAGLSAYYGFAAANGAIPRLTRIGRRRRRRSTKRWRWTTRYPTLITRWRA